MLIFIFVRHFRLLGISISMFYKENLRANVQSPRTQKSATISSAQRYGILTHFKSTWTSTRLLSRECVLLLSFHTNVGGQRHSKGRLCNSTCVAPLILTCLSMGGIRGRVWDIWAVQNQADKWTCHNFFEERTLSRQRELALGICHTISNIEHVAT